MKITMTIFLIMFMTSCARTLERDYKVVDASHQEVPEWVEDLEEYIDDEIDEEVVKKSRFYTYSTVAKNDRDIACKIANANASSAIAAEISTFIEEKFKQELDGDSSDSSKKLNEFVQNDLKKIVKANIVGAQKFREYWEKRKFMVDKGASKNWDGYVCTVLFKIPMSSLNTAFKRTEQELVTKVDAKDALKAQALLQKTLKEYLKEKESN